VTASQTAACIAARLERLSRLAASEAREQGARLDVSHLSVEEKVALMARLIPCRFTPLG
jgi:hypothetical protein